MAFVVKITEIVHEDVHEGYKIVHAIMDDQTEASAYVPIFKVGSEVKVVFDDKYDKAKFWALSAPPPRSK